MSEADSHSIADAVRQQEAYALASAERSAVEAHNDRAGSWNETRHLSEVLKDLPFYNGQALPDLVNPLHIFFPVNP